MGKTGSATGVTSSLSLAAFGRGMISPLGAALCGVDSASQAPLLLIFGRSIGGVLTHRTIYARVGVLEDLAVSAARWRLLGKV